MPRKRKHSKPKYVPKKASNPTTKQIRALKKKGLDKSQIVARVTHTKDGSGHAKDLSAHDLEAIGFSDKFINAVKGHLPRSGYNAERGKGGKGGRGGKGHRPDPKPKPKPDNPAAEPLAPPVDALVEWRRQHPVTPPTFTGEWAGDLGGGPMQTAPGAPPKHNGAPLYGGGSPYSAPSPQISTTSTPAPSSQSIAPETTWGQLLTDYAPAPTPAPSTGVQYSSGDLAIRQGSIPPFPVRPDINPETTQQMMNKVSGGYFLGGGA